MEYYKILPSELSFAFNECKRCYYLKSKYNVIKPSVPLAKIYYVIDKANKEFYINKKLNELCENLPNAEVYMTDGYVRSQAIEFPEYDIGLYISGYFDAIVKYDDNSYGVIDFKTSQIDEYTEQQYIYQLNAYAYAINHMLDDIKINYDCSINITKLGLIIFCPNDGFEILNINGDSILKGKTIWKELEYNEEKFVQLLNNIAKLLAGDIPEYNENCKYCKRDKYIIEQYSKVVQ